ncbi:MAG: Stk1 family PASTA domain-containing Ser/Thr kinase [bacterium]|nr:Stk1 family PASTA domain-containing Ser/Thr kinase [bacterium]
MINKGELIDNRYKIVKSIGEGGMANVYLAWDTILEREVAVKILRGDLSNDEKFVRRFQREANSASSLRHPNIVEMYDVGEDDGKYFIVMEFVPGKTLKSLIKKRGALTLTETLDIMQQLTSGIICAHDSYIIHRDIKPQNVLILEDGRVKITDFGIAMALKSNEITQTNSVMGSVHYLPPEQASGAGSTIKSDIYSLGILMFELLTGKVPFKGENAVEIAIKHMKDPIPSVCNINPMIPQSVENIILKCCAKNPKNRYDSVSEMYEDLKNCLKEEKSNEERLVYKYPEHNTDNTKTISRLESREIRNKNNNDDNEEKSNSKLNLALKIAGIVCISIVIIGLAFIWVFSLDNTKDVYVPNDLLGLTEKKACEKLKKSNLNCEVEYSYSEEYGDNGVMSVSPKSNTKIKSGNTVRIVVSTFKETIEVEDYTKKNLDTVTLELENLGVKVVKISKKVTKDDNIEENTIVGQNLEPGSRLPKNNGVIELTYATLITVYPDFTDGTYTKDLIEQFCDDNKITCIFKEEEDNNYKDGAIIMQSRDIDSEVKAGTTLTITIAKNKEKTIIDNNSDKLDQDGEEG